MLPAGTDYGNWRSLSRIDLEDRFCRTYGFLTTSDEVRDAFLDAEAKLSRSFLLVKYLDDCRVHADEVIFCQQVRKQLLKSLPGEGPVPDVERAVHDIVDKSIEADEIVDIYRAAGIERPDVSILDDGFLQTFKDQKNADLRLKLLNKLLGDEIRSHEQRNLAKARSFRELLETTLLKYHNRLIDAASVIREMIAIRKQIGSAAAQGCRSWSDGRRVGVLRRIGCGYGGRLRRRISEKSRS